MEHTHGELDDADVGAAMSAKVACEKAYYFFCALRDDSDPKLREVDPAGYETQLQKDRARYEKFRDEAIATALSIKDEIAQGFVIHDVIKLCRSTHEIDLAKKLFKEVDDDGLRAQILADAPELAGEKKKRLSDDEKAGRTVTINLDGLDRRAIVGLVVKAMRDVGIPQRDIHGFIEDARKADYATMLADAIGWGAPVRFVKDGEPWFRGDWRRLTPWQRVKRRVSLLGGSYTHPDGTLELDFEEKAGVNPGDSEEVERAKLKTYNERQFIKDLKGRWFFYGFIVASLIAALFGSNVFGWDR